MVAVLIVGGGLGWVASRARLQRDAVATILRRRGMVGFDTQWPRPMGVVRPKPEPAWARWVAQMLGRDYVDTATSVFLSGHEVDDEAMRAACRLPWLLELWLENTQVTDAGVEDLGRLTNLRVLDLKLNKISSRSLLPIARMTELRDLRLAKIPLRDRDLAFLERLTNLERLQIPSVTLTDAWL
jgi:hypothetical protein